MALWLEPGQEPTTEAERADLDAIEALRESCVLELKEEGNEFLKKGKQFHSRALDSYTRGIDQGCSNELTNSVLYANRAHVNLLLGNFRRALSDSEESIRRNPTNLKAYFRGAKASLELGLLSKAGRFCSDGLLQDPDNKELRKIQDQVDREAAKDAEKKKWALEARSKAEALFSALSSRKLKLGDALYEERSQSRRPWLDTSQVLHWPVLLLYGEVMSSDLVEDFCEIETFAVHLDDMFGKDAPPLVWDERQEYTRDRIALHYYANAYEPLSRKKALDLLSGQGAGYDWTTAEDDESDKSTSSTANRRAPSWIRVSENETLSSVLSRGNHIVPGIPVFYVTAKGTSFHHMLTSGQWSPP